MTEVREVLEQRGKRYGKFIDQAICTQNIKRAFLEHAESTGTIKLMEDDQFEAISMIASKLARIANGDPNYDDNWVDIAGYAMLVANRLNGEEL